MGYLNFSLQAKDFGVHGKTFLIAEEDLLDYIKKRIKATDSQAIQKHYENAFQNPSPVQNLAIAQTETVHYFDPTIVAKIDVKDNQGKIIVKKGSSYNPLDYGPLSQDLLFFDGEQASHIQWAKNQSQEAKWILVKGKPFELGEQENRAVFFDQFGLLTTKLSIKEIPSKVTQEGKRLKIESALIKEIACTNS